jgi:hypothetical protein
MIANDLLGLSKEIQYNFDSNYIYDTIIFKRPYSELTWSCGGIATLGDMIMFATDDFTADTVLLSDDVLNILFEAFGFFWNQVGHAYIMYLFLSQRLETSLCIYLGNI